MRISPCEFIPFSEIPADVRAQNAVSEVLVEASVEVMDLDGDIISVLMSAPAGI